ncbi:MAG: hypothetical protein HUU16_00030 [Candidatus Omnitrophica bacterium]|nr:hypothetical protein [Candidatus Omnitrophota bacterium]
MPSLGELLGGNGSAVALPATGRLPEAEVSQATMVALGPPPVLMGLAGVTLRVKVTGAVMTLAFGPSVDLAGLTDQLRAVDPGIEFDTELRREFGQRGELKRGPVLMLMVEGRGDKATVRAIVDRDGEQLTVETWADNKAKAIELLTPLALDEKAAAKVERALGGIEAATLPFLAGGVEVSYRESERDGKIQRRLVEFHRVEKGNTQ